MEEIKSKFLDELIKKPRELVASTWVIDKIPHIFQENMENYAIWRSKLALRLEVDPSALIITGSGSVGISLNPYKNFKCFDANSDIDVAVISEYHFNQAWRALRNLGTDYYSLSAAARQSVIAHRERYIYWGTIATDRILPILPFGKEWDKALTEMNDEVPTTGRLINARIYKDFDSLRAYQVNNLTNLYNTEVDKGTLNV